MVIQIENFLLIQTLVNKTCIKLLFFKLIIRTSIENIHMLNFPSSDPFLNKASLNFLLDNLTIKEDHVT